MPPPGLAPLDHPITIHEERLTRLDRAALFVTDHLGTFGMFLVIIGWSVVWLLWNTFAPKALRFDPAPAFVLWLFLSNLIQITLMPLLMVATTLQSKHDNARADAMYQYAMRNELLCRVIIDVVLETAADARGSGMRDAVDQLLAAPAETLTRRPVSDADGHA